MTLSLIVPTYRRPEQISALLSSISQQSINPQSLEVIVVGNLSCVQTSKHCEKYKNSGMNLHYFETGKLGVNVARNAGLEIAQGEICVFLDDDCLLPDPFWLNKVIQKFNANSEVDGFGGYYLHSGKFNFWGLIYYIKLRSWLKYYQVESQAYRLLGGCMAFRRKKIGAIRFDNSIVFGGAETDFVLRLLSAGLRLQIDEELSVQHSFHLSFQSFLSKVSKQGRYHWKSQGYEKYVMPDFKPQRPFREIQKEVVEELKLFPLKKLFVPSGLWLHQKVFYGLKDKKLLS